MNFLEMIIHSLPPIIGGGLFILFLAMIFGRKAEGPDYKSIDVQTKREWQRLRDDLKAHADLRHADTIRAIRVEEKKRIQASRQKARTAAQTAPTDAPNSAGGTPPQAAALGARLSGSQVRSVQTPKSDSSD